MKNMSRYFIVLIFETSYNELDRCSRILLVVFLLLYIFALKIKMLFFDGNKTVSANSFINPLCLARCFVF